MKHYALGDRSSVSRPYLLFEVRFDFHDVRSGYRGSDYGIFSAPPIHDQDLDLTPDLVRRLPTDQLMEIEGLYPVGWPEGYDAKIENYFLKHQRTEIWKNHILGIYSNGSESPEDFIARCTEILLEEKTRLLRSLYDLFQRRFLELEQRALAALEGQDWAGAEVDRRASEIKEGFSSIREQFGSYCLNEPGRDLEAGDLLASPLLDIETREKLASVWEDFLGKYNHIQGQFHWKATQIEPYEVPLSRGGVEVLSKGIFWE